MSNFQAQRKLDLYRKFKSNLMVGVTIAATIVALIPLFAVLGYLLTKGAASVNWHSYESCRRRSDRMAGGMANAIVGTFELVGIATLNRRADWRGWRDLSGGESRAVNWPQIIRFSADVMMGIPSIVIGHFRLRNFVRPFYGFSTLSGGIALALIMIRWSRAPLRR